MNIKYIKCDLNNNLDKRTNKSLGEHGYSKKEILGVNSPRIFFNLMMDFQEVLQFYFDYLDPVE